MTEASRATVLVVDDSEDNRFTVRRYLEQAGFRVVEGASGEDTIRLVRANPDIVILDVDLPDTNGFEVCRVIKTDPETAAIPVLNLSATFTMTRHRVQGLDSGADAYLCHPVEAIELVATVNALLRVRRAEQALRDADRRKDEFLAMLAHELRNPLAPIRTAVEVLKMRDATDPPIRRVREIVDRQVSHMSRLIDDLLDVSRIARGKVALQRGRCDFARIVRDTAEDYRGTLEVEKLRLDVRTPDAPVWVSGDHTRLAQVVGNVLHNARKFTDAGGRVQVTVEADAGAAVVTVTDTGIGMDEDTLRQVFEPFAQADRSLDRSRGGLGLGLALVKGLVELHGGEVRAASDGIGRGSSFTIRLPLDNDSAARGQDLPPPSLPRAGRRVLVIEDNLDVAESLDLLLGMMGHDVRIARNGADGVAAVSAFRPDLVLCDIGLPGGMDGFAVATALRADPTADGAYLVALTGYGQPEDRAKAIEAGFDVHLTKPVDGASLHRVFAAVARRLSGGGGA
ncbi:response regulator [Limnoglobus roseus]|uniref:histidine kinase n=1 Tax=Limnoglobus roseus TaxID=2598579 RepID=A0A5C1ABM2_9BACT|nr:response regulator [Limnoglobus roseus]QEL15573.1 hybrid sensor histidine kinase/response regulator [Limnoglobus roseus]